jgi:hypothetical protein
MLRAPTQFAAAPRAPPGAAGALGRCSGVLAGVKSARRAARRAPAAALQERPAMRRLEPGDAARDALSRAPLAPGGHAAAAPSHLPSGAGAAAPAAPQQVRMVYAGAAAPAAGAAAARGSFSRSMMVAGFDEDAGGDGAAHDLPLDYAYTWSRDDYSAAQRTLDTWTFVLLLRARLWLLDQKWSYGPAARAPEAFAAARGARARALGAWIRDSLLQLGPTFIKLGQLFSARADLFPAEFVEELSKLQDRVPAFPAEAAARIVERELGAPLAQLFAEFDPRPIAAASLGQVHLARLHSGERVAVKVQRPGLRRLFDIDLGNLKAIAARLDAGEDGPPGRNFTAIAAECADVLYREIDYIAEGRSADRFRRNFRGIGSVRVPRVYWQNTSGAVLTMEYLPGVKITQAAGVAGATGAQLAARATEAYLQQILRVRAGGALDL